MCPLKSLTRQSELTERLMVPLGFRMACYAALLTGTFSDILSVPPARSQHMHLREPAPEGGGA